MCFSHRHQCFFSSFHSRSLENCTPANEVWRGQSSSPGLYLTPGASRTAWFSWQDFGERWKSEKAAGPSPPSPGAARSRARRRSSYRRRSRSSSQRHLREGGSWKGAHQTTTQSRPGGKATELDSVLSRAPNPARHRHRVKIVTSCASPFPAPTPTMDSPPPPPRRGTGAAPPTPRCPGGPSPSL